MSTDSDHRRIGPFQLEGRLGVGGMGIVYRATYLKGGQKVALKVLAPDLMAEKKVAQRFEREMEILKKLKHPHIVKYYGGSTAGAQRYYAMELVTGGSLEQKIRQEGRLTWEQTVDYGIQIAKALQHAHDAGVIHRDLKPANLLLTADGVLKLSDFGIARDTQSTALTAAGKTVGTMAYMAPEQITGKHPITRRTDLYALGCVLFEMLTGRPPFQSETQPELLFKHIEEEPPSVREFNMDCPIWLDRLIQELLAKEPQDRPFDALNVQTRLEDVRQRTYAGESALRAAATAGGGEVTLQDRHPELGKLIGRKKKSKKKQGMEGFTPLYERTWFLGLCLLAVIAIATWLAWPKSEQQLYADLKEAMQHPDRTWRTAAEPEVRAFLERFPESPHTAEVRAWLDEIQEISAERKIASLELFPNRQPENDGQRLYLEARRFEKEGDRLGALERYEAMQVLLENKPDLKPYLSLARKRIDAIRASIHSEGDQVQFVRREIAAGDDLYLTGKSLQARERWRAILKFYEGKPEFSVLMELARRRVESTDAATAIREFPLPPEAR